MADDARGEGRERASAGMGAPQPAARIVEPSAPRAGGSRGGAPSSASPGLHEAEAWLVAAIASGADPEGVDEWVTAGPRLSAEERLSIYRYGYRARLVECLLDDYPALAAALGSDRFEALCHGYVDRFPSSSPSLNAFGRHMARHVESALGDPFLADLAKLEWTLVEVIHAASPARFDFGALTRIPSERWGDVRLEPSDTARLLSFGFPVNAWYQAFRTSGEVPPPPAAGPSATAVYRRDFRLWRMDLTPAMTRVLDGIFSGCSLGVALGRMGADEENAELLAEAERSVMVWFREWVDAGFFCAATLPDPG